MRCTVAGAIRQRADSSGARSQCVALSGLLWRTFVHNELNLLVAPLHPGGQRAGHRSNPPDDTPGSAAAT